MRYFLLLLALTVSIQGFAIGGLGMQVPVDVTCDSSGEQLIAPNPIRKYLIFVNKGSVAINVTPNAAPTGTTGIPILAGQNYEQNVTVGVNSWYCKTASSSTTISVTEGY
jgi:hypothetical protein